MFIVIIRSDQVPGVFSNVESGLQWNGLGDLRLIMDMAYEGQR